MGLLASIARMAGSRWRAIAFGVRADRVDRDRPKRGNVAGFGRLD
jgi:hypothetical protein